MPSLYHWLASLSLSNTTFWCLLCFAAPGAKFFACVSHFTLCRFVHFLGILPNSDPVTVWWSPFTHSWRRGFLELFRLALWEDLWRLRDQAFGGIWLHLLAVRWFFPLVHFYERSGGYVRFLKFRFLSLGSSSLTCNASEVEDKDIAFFSWDCCSIFLCCFLAGYSIAKDKFLDSRVSFFWDQGQPLSSLCDLIVSNPKWDPCVSKNQ